MKHLKITNLISTNENGVCKHQVVLTSTYVVGSEGKALEFKQKENIVPQNNLESYCLLFLTFSCDSNNTDVGNDKMTDNNIVRNKNNNIEAAKDLVPGDVVLEASPLVSGTIVLNQFETRSLLHFQMLFKLGLKGQFWDILVKKNEMLLWVG